MNGGRAVLVINRRKKLFLKMETVYFAQDHRTYETDAHIVLFYLSEEYYPGAREFSTLRFDLTMSEEELFNSVSKTTRRRIRQAVQAGEYSIAFDDSPGDDKINEFCDNYDDFAVTKGIAESDRRLLFMARERNALCVSALRDSKGNMLCGTADIFDGRVVLGMYAYSHFRRFEDSGARSKISNANRYLYWELIRYYKQKGLKIMDMGGLGMGKEGPGLDSVDDFKLSFGGTVTTLYHFYFAKSLVGKFIIWITGRNKKIAY